MKLMRYNNESMISAYGIKYQSELNPNNSCGASFFPSFCRVEENGETLLHSHYETEAFLITKGKALAIVEGKEFLLQANDQLLIHPFEKHIIKNIGSEPLEFFSVYSRVNSKVDTKDTKTLIISAPPTPNGRLHLGHLSGPYLSADILNRFLLLKGRKVKHYSATDDNQTYTFKMAKDFNKDQQEIVQHFHELIHSDLKQASIHIDDFISPNTDKGYEKFIKEKFELLKKNEAVSIKNIEFPFLNNYQYEAFLEGTCPKCQTKTTGQCCEACGFVGEARDFNQSNLKSNECFTLDLSHFKDFLKDYHSQLDLRGKVAKRAKEWRENLGSFTISYPEDIGISGMHVWCEMAFGMLYQIEKFNEKENELIYCFGIDNSFYYLILIPSILKALEQEDKLPYKVIANDFYSLNGHKFSTSREHAIWAKDIEGKDWDYLRLYLSLNRSEKKIGNYNHNEFLNFSEEIAKKLASIKKIERNIEINKEVILTKEGQRFYKRLIQSLLTIENNMAKNISLNIYAQKIIQLLNDYLEYVELGEGSLTEKSVFLPLVKMAFHPIMPNTFKSKEFGNLWSLDLRGQI